MASSSAHISRLVASVAAVAALTLLLTSCENTREATSPSPAPSTAASAVTTPPPPAEASPVINLDLLPAWTAFNACPKKPAVAKVMHTGRLTSSGFFTFPNCDYTDMSTKTGFYLALATDRILTDKSLHDPKATFTDLPDLGKDAVQIEVTMKEFGTHSCKIIVRLGQAHGADRYADPYTTLQSSVTQPAKSKASACGQARTLLQGFSHRIPFAAGFAVLPRYAVNCKLDADTQAERFTAFLTKHFGPAETWQKRPNFEAVARPATNLLTWCGQGDDYPSRVLRQMGITSATWKAMTAWAKQP